LHKTKFDEALEPVEPAGAVPASTDTVPPTPQKKRRRRRSRRRGKANASAPNGAVSNGIAPEPNGTAPEAAARPAVAPVNELAQPQPSGSPPASRVKRAQARRRRQRADLGSWRAEPPGERGRWRPGQAQAHSPSLWMAWNAFHFGKGNDDSES